CRVRSARSGTATTCPVRTTSGTGPTMSVPTPRHCSPTGGGWSWRRTHPTRATAGSRTCGPRRAISSNRCRSVPSRDSSGGGPAVHSATRCPPHDPAVGGIRRHVVAWSGMSDLSELARRHLWMHFTRLGSYSEAEVPVISRGEGCYVWDQHGKMYLDGLSGLFTVQAGHGRAELGQAAARQAETLGYFPVWSFAHEPGIELATRLAALDPGDLNRVFLTPSGGEAIDTTIKLVRQYFKLIGQP